ncbi:MAG: hypothetical protein ACE5KM_20335 [Planctomycetaceae bacterium]
MTSLETTSLVIPLKSARDELALLNRTVTHALSLASERRLLTTTPYSQHMRRAPSTWGYRCDAFFWDAWDRSIRGEDDMHRFFAIAQRIGGHLSGLEETPAANLLPGGVVEINGSCSDLFRPDYWLFVVHHLGRTGQLPYECQLDWSCGSSFNDEPFAVVSRLTVNIVQASIDALTVLIDATPHSVWDRKAQGFVPREAPVSVRSESNGCDAGPNSASSHIRRVDAPEQTSGPHSRANGRRNRKRAERAASIEALTTELKRHIRAAREHAQTAVDFGRTPDLLPRPSQKDLAERVGITVSAASRCFNDPSATELRLLWETAGDLDALLKYVRSPAS